MTKDKAAELHCEVIARFRLRGNELKGSNLVKHKQGREAVSWLLGRSVEHSLLVVSDKRCALAGRFYEYIFEPLLANQSTMLYNIEFHQFVATVLYCHFAAGDSNAEGLLKDFETLMRTLDPQQVDAVVSHVGDVELTGPLGYLLVIALCQRDKIKKEIEFLRNMKDGPRWELELSAPSVLDFTQNPEEVMDDITFVRSHWWLVSEGFSLSTANSDVQKLPATLYHRIADSLAYAA